MNNFIEKQIDFEKNISKENRKSNGVFFTNEKMVIDKVIGNINLDEKILKKKILEPSCGNGIFLLSLIEKLSETVKSHEVMRRFIEENLYFNDIDSSSVKETKANISKLFFNLYGVDYDGKFNSSLYDFTIKENFKKYFDFFDFVLGNPPYVSLYGRRDQKKNEEQREYFLKNYSQFPSTLKNGKINLVMIFIEQSINLLKKDGKLSFIIDVAFFETAYVHMRKYLLENTQITDIEYDLDAFKGVASGQVILKVTKGFKKGNKIKIVSNIDKNKNFVVSQDKWNNKEDQYKFRIDEYSEVSNNILDKVFYKKDKTLKEAYPEKNLRTGTMLLNMESEFVFKKTEKYEKEDISKYPYYRGSKSIKDKYSKPKTDLVFYFDEDKKLSINEEIQAELELKGIKNKKRLGFGESLIYDNPKIYIRQSAKELIATYDENRSSSNNSLYIFSLRNDNEDSKSYLKFLTGFLNSKIVSFIAQKRRIIRYSQGKQPQIKVSDLYDLNVPEDKNIQAEVCSLVNSIIQGKDKDYSINKIDDILFDYYNIDKKEIEYIEKSISSFKK